MTTEQLNEVLVEHIATVNDRIIGQLQNLREMMKRYCEDSSASMTDFENLKKQERINVMANCLMTARDSKSLDEALQRLASMLESTANPQSGSWAAQEKSNAPD